VLSSDSETTTKDKMTDKLSLVREFMQCMGQTTPNCQRMPSAETIYLRYELQNEESREIADAQSMRDLLDGIVDLLYVTYGTAVAAGFSPKTIDLAFEEVHRSNMSKLWSESEIQKAPVGSLIVKQGSGSYVVKSSTGKVIKSPSYQPAQLKQYLVNGGAQ